MIRLMTRSDIPAGMRLKEAAGWNQTEQDWENLLSFEPEGCWVCEVDGAVAGSTTAVCYGEELAWVGMVLVLPEFRRRGIAQALLEHALRFVQARRVACVKLDATDMGRPLYQRLGFQDEAVIERWATTVPAGERRLDETPPPLLQDVSQIEALDRQAFGAGRRRLLQLLLRRFGDECWALPQACLMARPGSNAHFLGPCVAQSTDQAKGLIDWFLAQHRGQPVYWDLLPQNSTALGLARSFGFHPKRTLMRMSLTAESCAKLNRTFNLERCVATAGFEYG